MHPRDAGLLGDLETLGALLRKRWVGLILSLHRLRIGRPTGSCLRMLFLAPSLLLLFLVLVLVMAISFGQAASEATARRLFQAMLLASFSTALSGSVSTSVQSLFLNPELRFLLTLPVTPRVLFTYKLGDVLKGAIPGWIFGFAICFGYVLGQAQAWHLLPVALVIVSLLVLTAATIAATLAVVVARYAPPKRTRALLTATSLLILTGTGLAWRATSRSPEAGGVPIEMPGWLRLVPSDWAYRSLQGSIEGEIVAMLLAMTGLFVVWLVVLGIGSSLFERTVATNLDRVEAFQTRATIQPTSGIWFWLVDRLPMSIRCWSMREWLQLSRDYGRLSTAILPVVSVSLWAVGALIWREGSNANPTRAFWAAHGPVLLIPWALSSATTIYAFGAERSQIDLLRTLPARGRQLFIGKLVAYVGPIAIVSSALATLSALLVRGSLGDSLLLVLSVMLLSGLIVLCDLASATLAPRFRATQVQRTSGFVAKMFATVTSIALGAVLMTAIATSPLGRKTMLAFLGRDNGPDGWIWIPLAVALLLTLGVLTLGGIRRTDRMLTAV